MKKNKENMATFEQHVAVAKCFNNAEEYYAFINSIGHGKNLDIIKRIEKAIKVVKKQNNL